MSSRETDSGVGRLAPTPPPAPSVEEEDQSLLRSILRRRKRYVVVTTVVAVLATLALTLSQTKTYSATATAVVQAPPPRGARADLVPDEDVLGHGDGRRAGSAVPGCRRPEHGDRGPDRALPRCCGRGRPEASSGR